MSPLTVFSIAAAALVAAPAASLVSSSFAKVSASFPAQRTYALVMDYRGDTFVLDHGLSIGDCFDAMPRNDAAKHIGFACEMER